MKRPIYLDYNATTPTDPRVVDVMLPYFSEKFGNPASNAHLYGWETSAAVEQVRANILKTLGAKESAQLVFTSGATESNNLVILGTYLATRDRSPHFITQVTEHKSVLDVYRAIEALGARVTYLPVDHEGYVDPDALQRALTPNTVLVSIMHANNEIGTIQPLETLSTIVHTHSSARLHVDAAQSVGKIPISLDLLGIDYLSLSAHKLYGPKGIGALYVRQWDDRHHPKKTPSSLHPLFFGGGQEYGLRSGTLPVPLIVGLGEALRLANDEMTEEMARLTALAERLITRLLNEVPRARLNGPRSNRLPTNLNFSFEDIQGDFLMAHLHGLALSSGSACASKDVSPSHVLKGIGLSDTLARASIRVSLGRFTTESEIDTAGEMIINAALKAT